MWPNRDLRQELYPHFKRILDALLELIDPSKPELTGEVFRTLTNVFMYLSKQLLADIEAVRGYYGRLLGHKYSLLHPPLLLLLCCLTHLLCWR